jgi:hypothetical protein
MWLPEHSVDRCLCSKLTMSRHLNSWQLTERSVSARLLWACLRLFLIDAKSLTSPDLVVLMHIVQHAVEVVVEVNLLPTVSRRVCPGARRPSGTRDQFFILLEISFRQLRVCYFVAPSLTRRRVCNLLYNCFWALPEQSLLGPSPAEPTTIFYCIMWDSPNLEGQVPVFISPRNRASQLYLRELGLCNMDS